MLTLPVLLSLIFLSFFIPLMVLSMIIPLYHTAKSFHFPFYLGNFVVLLLFSLDFSSLVSLRHFVKHILYPLIFFHFSVLVLEISKLFCWVLYHSFSLIICSC
jgi:hypothetical protein